jgi:hypothetical protein
MRRFLTSFGIALLLLQAPGLEAGGWGKTGEVVECDGASWNTAYFDLSDLYFTVSIPNYSGASMSNGNIAMRGQIKGEAGYLVETSFNPGFQPPAKAADFVTMIELANPTATVVEVDASVLGFKYAVDILPNDEKDAAYWRFAVSEDRLIRMGTTDSSEDRRFFFFLYTHRDSKLHYEET